MALTKVTGQVIKNTTDVTVGVLTVTNTLAVGGTVSIGGTLTYEDVTNIDSVGLITARNGIVVGSGITLSKDGDIFATGVTTTGSLVSSGAISGTTGTFTGDVDIADKIIHTGDTNTAIRFPAADTFTVETGGSERARIDSSGDFGIGMSPSGVRLDVYSSSAADIARFSGPNSAGLTIRNDTANELQLHTAPSDALIFGTNGENERLRIDSSGRVLIGTTTEGEASADDLTIAGSGNQGITIRSGTSNYGLIYFSDATSGTGEYDGAVEYKHSDNFMVFRTGASERLRIASDGKIGINITGTDNTSPVRNLDIADSSGAILRLISSDDSLGANERVGEIEFYTDDDDAGHVSSFIKAIADPSDAFGRRGSLTFGTRSDSGNGTEKIRILHSGGITFNGDTATANALNDYEEGTFSPAFKAENNSSNASTTVNEAQYTKVGDLVYFRFYITLAAHASGTTGGSAFINGLPFTSVSGHGAISIGYFAGWNANQMFVTGTVQPGSNSLLFRHRVSVGTATANMDYDNNLQVGSNVIIAGVYQTTQ